MTSLKVFFYAQTFILSISLVGCVGRAMRPEAQVTSLNADGTHQVMTYTPDLRSTHIIKRDGRIWILTEPQPDAAFAYDEVEMADLSLINIPGGGGNDSGDASQSSGSDDLPLTGRSSYVVLSRELLFRLNEMAFNTGADFNDVASAYQNNLDIIKEIALAEAANSKRTETVSITTGASASTQSNGQSSKSGSGATSSTDEAPSSTNEDSFPDPPAEN